MTQYSNINTQSSTVSCIEKQVVKKYFTAWLILFLAPIASTVLAGINNLGLRLLLGNNEAIVALINDVENIAVFLSIVSSIAGHIVIIVGKIKFHNEKSINIAFWIDITTLILAVFAIITTTVLLIVGFFKFGDAFPELINESIQTFSDFLHNFS